MTKNAIQIKELGPDKAKPGSQIEISTKNTPVKRKAGRPPGAKNKETLFKELMSGQFQDIAEKNIEKTFSVLFERAHEGDMKAIKLIMDRVIPASKSVDMNDMEKKGLTVNISVGSMEQATIEGEIIEDGVFTEVEGTG